MKTLAHNLLASILGTWFFIIVIGSPVTVWRRRDKTYIHCWRPLDDSQLQAFEAAVQFLVAGKSMPPELDQVAQRRVTWLINGTLLALLIIGLIWPLRAALP